MKKTEREKYIKKKDYLMLNREYSSLNIYREI